MRIETAHTLTLTKEVYKIQETGIFLKLERILQRKEIKEKTHKLKSEFLYL